MNQYILIFMTLSSNVLAQLSLRKGMEGVSITHVSNIIEIFWSPNILFGLFCYVISFGLYLVVLSRFEVSYIYPIMMSLGFLMLLAFSVMFLDETFSYNKLLGTALIIMGIFVISNPGSE